LPYGDYRLPGAAMLQVEHPKVRYCLARAAECGRLAREAVTPGRQALFERLESAWLQLATNREFVDRVDRFLEHVSRD